MLHPFDPRFGPAAQTPQQRAYVLARMQEAVTSLQRYSSPQAKQLYDRYVAGELSWAQLRQALDTLG
jgi:hypothetical protein